MRRFPPLRTRKARYSWFGGSSRVSPNNVGRGSSLHSVVCQWVTGGRTHLVPEPCVPSTNDTLDLRTHAEPRITLKLDKWSLCERLLFEGEGDSRGSTGVGVTASSELGEVFMRVEGE